MKQILVITAACLFFFSCKKNNNGTDPALLEHYPQTWILTVDEAPDKYIFLKTNTAVMYRDHILRSYSLSQLAIDENCEWEVEQSRTEAGDKICYSLRLKKNKNIWCGVGPSSNQQEVHMHALNGTSADPGDGYKFFIHDMPKINGVKTVVLESVDKPGYYVSASPPGFQFAQNLVTLQQASSPQQATAWQCRHN